MWLASFATRLEPVLLMALDDKIQPPPGLTAVGAMPRTVIALGLVSLFMDISSEIIHSLLPAFLVTVLGVSAFSIGIIEGIAEATASVTRIFSGAISDWMGKRKPLVLLGYGMGALTKPRIQCRRRARCPFC
jgi:hypothetical protein